MSKARLVSQSSEEKPTQRPFHFFTHTPRVLEIQILKYLPIKDLAACASLSKYMKSLQEDENIWKLRLNELTEFKDFPKDQSAKASCKKIYKDLQWKGAEDRSRRHEFWNNVIIRNSPRYILQTPRFIPKLDNHIDLHNLSLHIPKNEYIPVLQYIMAHKNIYDKLNKNDMTIFFKNATTALEALKHPVLSKKIKDYTLHMYAGLYIETAQYILDNLRLFPQCSVETQVWLRKVVDQHENMKNLALRKP
ncbi:MAG: F-box protein [Gammaproteobacteria bacterium]